MIINRIFLFLELLRCDDGVHQNDYLLITVFLSQIFTFFYDAFALQIIERGLMTRSDYEEVSEKALSLFEYGQVNNLRC